MRLDAQAGFRSGRRQTAPLVKPGDPDKSLLVQVIRYDGDIKMPQKGKLADADIATLTAWVKGGARGPTSGAAGRRPATAFDLHARAKAHWSFQPVKRPAVPESRGQTRNPKSDRRFLLAKLREKGLSFAPPAEKRVLLRRVYFDLIGLPPTPEEIDAFLKDDSPDAYEKVVDRLLASPHYGERWGRHWLDLVRYAETHGHEFDFEIPDAWRYRDYVVRALQRRPAVRPVPHRARRRRPAARSRGATRRTARTSRSWRPGSGGSARRSTRRSIRGRSTPTGSTTRSTCSARRCSG